LEARSVLPKSDQARGNFAERVLLVVLTVWALAMIVPGLQRVFDTLDSFGLTVDNDGVVTDVSAPFRSAANSPAAVAGINSGDRIDLKAMRCIPLRTPQCAALVTVLGGLGGMHAVLPNQQIILTILPKSGGPPKIIKLQSALAPLGTAERFVLFADTIVGTAVIVIAFWLVWTRPSWMTWGLFLYVIWINPGQSFTYYALLQRWPGAVFMQEIAEAVAQGAAFAGLVIFALRFPEDRIEPRWRKIQWTVPLLAGVMTTLTLLSFRSLLGFPSEKITEISFLMGYAVDAAVLLILLVRRHGLSPPEEQRMRWVIWGCAIGLPAYILAELCQSSDLIKQLWGASPSQAFIGLLYLPNGVLAYFASQAVWQKRVVSVSIPLRHGTILVGLSLLLGIPIFQLHEKVGLFQESLRLPPWIWPLVVAPILLLLLQRLHEITVELVDLVLNRRFHSAQRQLERAMEAIVRAETLGEIDRVAVESSVRALCLSSGAVFRSDGMVFRRWQDTLGWNASMKKELHPESDAIALRSLEVGVPIRLPHDSWNAPGMPSGLEKPCLAVSVKSWLPQATAVFLFGPHQTGNDISADERGMLERLATRSASAYERVITGTLQREVEQLKQQLSVLQGTHPVKRAES
jgi:hypothetical protein